jgi:hypothetical protein
LVEEHTELRFGLEVTHPRTGYLGLRPPHQGSKPSIQITHRWPSSVSAADLNGDGRIDLVIPNELAGTVSVLLNRS